MVKSDNTQQMLRAILNGQSSFRQEILKRFDGLEERVDGLEVRLDIKIDNLEKRLTNRIDRLGKQLAYLEDDTPTREEFDKLEKKVAKPYQATTSTLH